MLPVGFEPAIPASERPKAHASDRAATGIGLKYTGLIKWITTPAGSKDTEAAVPPYPEAKLLECLYN